VEGLVGAAATDRVAADAALAPAVPAAVPLLAATVSTTGAGASGACASALLLLLLLLPPLLLLQVAALLAAALLRCGAGVTRRPSVTGHAC
jgi:hypothetical protein